jgi:23S rRNA pseudouridine1911/1915/1917 synthase
MQPEVISARIPDDYAGQRLDQALVALFPGHTRSQLQKWIKAGRVHVSVGAVAVPGVLVPAAPRDKVRGGETVEIHPPPPAETGWHAQAIPLEIVYEDKAILVINKPPGLVVHPGAGNPEDTLLNALLHHAPALNALPRAGIVHRLDKDTSGLLVVAKTERARQHLIEQLQERTVAREYVALVNGVMIAGSTVDAPIGRHRHDRTRMAVSSAGKEAVSHVRVLKKYRAHTLVQVNLESGRTHQIRVHLAHLKYPVVGDPVYGGRLRIPAGADERLRNLLQGFKRQALHAVKLALVHPVTGKTMQWVASVPGDMGELMEALAKDAKGRAE